MKRFFICLSLVVACVAGGGAQNRANQGEISGRVVTEDGSGISNLLVLLTPVAVDPRVAASARFQRTVTDDEGYFKFTGLAPRVYSINVSSAKGLVRQPIPASEMENRGYHRIGDNLTITMVRGGAIAGRVTNAAGEPVIGVRVVAIMVRDADGMKLRETTAGPSRQTDDRGIYRIYGLRPGAYIVSARSAGFPGNLSPYDNDAPTYYPSSARETAEEVTVVNGGEAAGVDIRYRGEHGHTISGTVSGLGETSPVYNGSAPSFIGTSISLISVSSGISIGGTSISGMSENNAGFAIHGVTDGEYEIVARRGGFNMEIGQASALRRVTVKGAGVGGIELKLAPLAAIAGKVAIEAAPNVCGSKRRGLLEETLIVVRRDERQSASQNLIAAFGYTVAPNKKGDFTIHNLPAGRYFVEPQLFHDDWYMKAVSMAAAPVAGRRTPAGSAPAANLEVARNGLAVKSGERLAGLAIQLAEGAAGLSGRIVAAGEGATLPLRMRVHLVPAEAAAAGDVARYAEATTRGSSAFTFRNLAPGRYFLLARIIPDSEPADRQQMPVALDAIERAKLRQEAEARKAEIELTPCQRVKDHILRW